MNVPLDRSDEDVALRQLLAQLRVPAAIEITDGEGRVRRAAVGVPAIVPQYTASVTKQVTAAVAAMAVAEGR